MPLQHYWLNHLARQAVANTAPSERASLGSPGVIVVLRLDGYLGICACPLLCSRGNGPLQRYVHLFRLLRRRYRHCIKIQMLSHVQGSVRSS